MQRLSSLAFGTAVGRFVTRFAIVPFGGAYLTLAFLRHMVEIFSGAEPASGDAALETELVSLGESTGWVSEHLSFAAIVVALGLFLMGLLNSARFRGAVAISFRVAFHILRFVVVEPICWIIRWEVLQRVLRSRLFRILTRFLLKPLIWTGLICLLLRPAMSSWHAFVGYGIPTFAGMNLLLNSRPGRIVEEVVADWLVQTWHRVGLRIITGVFWWVVDAFKRILEALEWLLYTIDEWLRFRTGQSTAMLVTKGAPAPYGSLWPTCCVSA